jgi:hypothetical protein
MINLDIEEKDLLLKELKGCYNFLTNEVNTDKSSTGYGLVRDKYPNAPEISSVAAVGFGLTSLIVGVENNLISFDEAKERAVLTLKTFLDSVQGMEGFYYHFINIDNGSREWNSEVSSIDTGIFLCGALTVGQFFGDVVEELADKLYRRVNWQWFIDEKRDMFRMAYRPEQGFAGYWDVYAEQLMLYVLGAGSPTYNVGSSPYNAFIRNIGSYGEYKDIINSWFGSLFTYQYSHAFIDFRDTFDKNGISWWDNSVKATLANRQYCIDNQDRYKTFNENSWGITACVNPSGYEGRLGAKPSSHNHDIEKTIDGTIAPSGAIGSIVFTPRESISALANFYTHTSLIGKYGLKDSYNIENGAWYAKEYLGIDKGISLVMIQNFLNQAIWNSFMKNEYIRKGMDKICITKVKKL